MNWREFKRSPEGIKGIKGNMPQETAINDYLKPLKPFLPEVETATTAEDLHRLIGETLAYIDRQGRPWNRFFFSLTVTDRQQLRDAEAQVDKAVLAGDLEWTVTALDAYRDLVLGLRRRLH